MPMLTYPSNPQESKPSSGLRALLQRLGPYQSLTLLLVTSGIAEPMKLVAVAVVGDGHWITGTAIIVAAYATRRNLRTGQKHETGHLYIYISRRRFALLSHQ